ncbi:ROK family protein [Microbacterium sp. A588]
MTARQRVVDPLLGEGEPVVAFDVGGTDIKAALFDECGAMLGLSRTPTPVVGAGVATGSADAVLDRLQHLADEFAVRFPSTVAVAAGLAVPGNVDEKAGVVVHALNLGWDDVPVRALAHGRLGVPVALSHDVRAAGDAERRLGAADGADVVVMMIGTGIAATVYAGGHPLPANSRAGEVGHSIVDPRGPLCACGSRGCVEAVASAGAIARRYQERSGTRIDGAREVLRRAATGDELAAAVWAEAVDALALSIVQLVAVLAPEKIVIGGGLAQAGEALFLPLRRRVDELLSFQQRPQLVPARMGGDAGLLGAALRARDLCARQLADTD